MDILKYRTIKLVIAIILIVICNTAIFKIANLKINGDLMLEYSVQSDVTDSYQLFYSTDDNWSEENSYRIQYTKPQEIQIMNYKIPMNAKKIRLDFGDQAGKIKLSKVELHYLWKVQDISKELIEEENQYSDISNITQDNQQIIIDRSGNDAFICIDLERINVNNLLGVMKRLAYTFKIILCIAFDILMVLFIKKRHVIRGLAKEVMRNRALIWKLSKNDFKTKYAGSYLGIIWAFVQPIVTILVYWFVFQVGFKSAPIENFPYALWLIAGIVPWFFFSEAFINATNSMIEYSYLVKKVVFKISILPIVKIISALFVHTFFIVFTIIIFILCGYKPDIFSLQVLYYTGCMFIYILGVSYATCAIVVFFRDLGQIISIFMQVGMWMTPIMWSYTMIPEKYQWILKINPMYYIVEGYRDSLINKVWFIDRFNQTLYFWILTIGLFGIGAVIFKKLKVHFADVL